MAKAGDQYEFRTGNIWNFASRDDVATVRRLISEGIPADLTNKVGWTPLHAACIDLALAAERVEASLVAECVSCVSLLLARGAPLGAVSADGKTALDLCKAQEEEGHEMASLVADVLRQAAGAAQCSTACHAAPSE